ncbi:alpha/beta hydrolase [Agromyces badenianii]|uniref:Alpha/beta hydrolase n=1 Tax=Agromyces badenianii TaxID=2080742 RepID=A0A2S0WUY8_9MICO|nr:alpha/beta hydrolase [Agromyces badenianii]AWB95110.1 alpha/beta hydrolase [Agromyces badenianii]PWC03188.1 alpha/beta hydrolase [Agromyces badenianii]
MVETIFRGIRTHQVETPRLAAGVLERRAESPAKTVVFVHGNVSSSLFWQPTMLALPPEIAAYAVDLRGFGDSETLPVDATRGLRDFSDDVASVVDALDLGAVHLVGWSMGGGVVMQLLLDRPELVASLTLQSTVSPFGFGGTALDGSLLTPDAAGTGGGGVNPDFVARLAAGDRSDEAGSPRAVYRSSYVAPGFVSEHEDVWVESMLSTAIGADNYPGDSTATEHWPGFAPGAHGVLNTMVPTVFDTSGIVDLDVKPPVLWIHGAQDAIVGDASFFDANQLGRAGVIPGWPGDEVAPPQPMISQTRAVLARYSEAGGAVTELELENCGHSPHLEHPEAFHDALVALLSD